MKNLLISDASVKLSNETKQEFEIRRSAIEQIKRIVKNKGTIPSLLPLLLAACGGGGGGISSPSPSTPTTPAPTPDFTESPTGTFTARDDNNRTLDEGSSSSALTVTGKGGNDSITTGSGDDNIDGGAGNDTINAGVGIDVIEGGDGDDTINGEGGNDLILPGAGADTVNAGDGDDLIVLIGMTTANQYSDAAISNPAGSGSDLSSLILLSNLNDHSTSDVSNGETIDGGSGSNILVVYGTVDLTNISLSNVTQLIVNSDVTLTADQLNQFTTVLGDGTSVLHINDDGEDGDVSVIDLRNIDVSGIDIIEVSGDVKILLPTSLETLPEINFIEEFGYHSIVLTGVDTAIDLANLMANFTGPLNIEVELGVTLNIIDGSLFDTLEIQSFLGDGTINLAGANVASDGLSNIGFDTDLALLLDDGSEWTPSDYNAYGINDIDEGSTENPGIYLFSETAYEDEESADYILYLTNPSWQTVSVDYELSDGTTGTATFVPGEQFASIPFSWTDDSVNEGGMVYDINFSNAINADLYHPENWQIVEEATGTLTVLDDEAMPTISIINADFKEATGNSITNSNAQESDGQVNYTILLSHAYTEEVTVQYTASDGSGGTVTFTPGETSQDITLNWADNDVMQPDYELGLLLHDANHAIIDDPRATLKIYDDDGENGLRALDGFVGTIVAGVPLIATIDYANDTDFYIMEVEAGVTYYISAAQGDLINGRVDHKVLSIYDANNGVLEREDGLYPDSSGSFGVGYFYTPQESGTIRINFSAWSGDKGNYILTADVIDTTESSGIADAFGDITTAATLALGEDYSGTLSHPGDVDFIAIELTAGETVRLTLTGEAENLDTIELYTSEGESLGSYGGIINNYTHDDGVVLADISVTETGTYYISLEAYHLRYVGDYNIQSEIINTGEPDGSVDIPADISTPVTLTLDVLYEGRLGFNADSDWYAVDLTAGQTYQIDMMGAGSGEDVIKLFYTEQVSNAAGELFEYDSWSQRGGQGDNLRGTFTAPADGLYYFNVQSAYQDTGNYNIVVSEYDGSEPSGIEDYANTIDTTGILEIGSTVLGRIGNETNGEGNEYQLNRDWFKVTLEAGKAYVFKVSGSGDDTEAQGYSPPPVLYDQSGNRIFDSNNYSHYSEDGDSYLVVIASESGTYFLEVEGGIGLYELSGEETSTLEPSGIGDLPNSASTPITISTGESYNGSLHLARDSDQVRIGLVEGVTYQVTITPTGADPLSDLQIIPLGGSWSYQVAADEITDVVTYVFSVDETGSYYIPISSESGLGGTYTISLSEPSYTEPDGSPDVGNIIDNAQSIPAETVITGEINYSDDSDWYSVELTAGEVWSISASGQLTNAGTLSHVMVYNLTGPDGESVNGIYPQYVYSDSGDGVYETSYIIRVMETGVYSFQISNSGSEDTGTYQLLAEQIDTFVIEGDADLPANNTTSGSFAVGETFDGYHGELHDVDWVAIDLEAGTPYIFTLTWDTPEYLGESHGPYVYDLYDADGWWSTSSSNGNHIDENRSGVFQVDESGTYYIAIQANNSISNYHLSASVLSASEPDDGADFAEEGGTRAIIEVGGSIQGELSFAGDLDGIAFDLVAGETYQIDIAASLEHDLYLSYVMQIDSEMGSNGQMPGNWEAFQGEGYYILTPSESGTYYIQIGASHSQDTGTYVVTLNNSGEAERDGSPDIPANVTTPAFIDIGQTIEVDIAEGYNQDWIAVTLTAGTFYEITLEGTDTGYGYENDALISGIYDADGMLIEGSVDDNGGEGNNSRISFNVTETGTYYIATSGAEGSAGTFNLTVLDTTGPAEGNDTMSLPGSTLGDFSLLSGDDVFVWNIDSDNQGVIDGGDGEDILQLHYDYEEHGYPEEFDGWDVHGSFSNFEHIEFTGAGFEMLTITVDQVIGITDADNELIISGDAGYILNSRDQGWVADGTTIINDATYNIFTSGEATLYVDPDLTFYYE